MLNPPSVAAPLAHTINHARVLASPSPEGITTYSPLRHFGLVSSSLAGLGSCLRLLPPRTAAMQWARGCRL